MRAKIVVLFENVVRLNAMLTKNFMLHLSLETRTTHIPTKEEGIDESSLPHFSKNLKQPGI